MATEPSTTAPALTNDRSERRRLTLATAARKYKQKKKTELVSLFEEVRLKEEQVVSLLRANAVLRARYNVLARAVEWESLAMSRLSIEGGSPEAHPGPQAALELQAQPAPVSPLLLEQQQQQQQQQVAAGPGPAVHGPLPPAGGSAQEPEDGNGDGDVKAGSPELATGWACPDAVGDELMGRVLQWARSSSPPPSPLGPPDEILLCLRQRFKEYVDAYKAGCLDEAARPHSLHVFKSMHSHMRQVFLANPLLRNSLLCVNLDTLEREPPPHGHWECVVVRSRAIEAMVAMPEPVWLELREMVGMMSDNMGKLRAQQRTITEQLGVLSAALHESTGTVHLSASCPEALSRQHAEYEALLDELSAAQRKESNLATSFLWRSAKALPIDVAARVYAESWPWLADTWGCFAATVAAVAEMKGGADGAPQADRGRC